MQYEKALNAAEYLAKKTKRMPTVGIILGSGLGGIVDIMTDKVVMPYESIPNFPKSTVLGHAHNLVFGRIGNLEVVAMQGRFHYYEGLTMEQLTYPVYVMKLLGVKSLIITNACGAINETFAPGDLMIIKDHINIFNVNPLIGENDNRFGPRFPDMSEAYSKKRIEHAKKVAKEVGVEPKEGVYMFYSGPSYETAAEIRAFKVLGADVVGMSTVPETVVANYLGMEVLAVACITNMATGIQKEKHSHQQVLLAANKASENLCKFIGAVLQNWEE